MTRSARIAILVLVLLTVLAALLRGYFTEERHLQRYSRNIEKYLHERETTAQTYISSVSLSPAAKPLPSVLQKAWGLAPFNISWYRGDSLVFSLNNRYLPFDTLPGRAVEGGSPYFFPSGGSKVFIGKWAGGEQIIWLPLWEHFDLENPLLKDGFTGFSNIPPSVVPTLEKTDFAIRGTDGKPLVFLQATAPLRDPFERSILFWLYLGIGLVAAFLVNKVAKYISRRYSPWLGVLFLVAFMVGMRWLLDPALSPQDVPATVFQQPILNQSLGGLLLNTLFLLWLMLFFHKEMEDLRFPTLSTTASVLISSVNYLSILLGMLLIAQTIRNIVLHSSLNVYLENIFDVDTGAILAIATMAVLFLAFFLFSHRMARVIVSMELRLMERMTGLGISLIAVVPFYFWSENSFPLPNFILAAIVYLGLLDFFSEAESPNLTWLFGWLGIFSGLTALLLSGFNLEKQNQIQQDLTRRLAVEWKEAPKQQTFGGIFEGLFAPPGFAEKAGLERVEYAIYRKGGLAEKSPGGNFPLAETALPAKPVQGALVESRTSDRIEWSFRHAGGTTAFTSRTVEGLLRPLSLFSYLFALFVLVLIPLLALLNYWLDFLPNTLDFIQLRRPTMSNRIQLSVFGILLVSFLLIGIISIWNFRNTADFNHGAQVKRKIDTIMEDVDMRLRQADTLPSAASLAGMLMDFGRFHELDMLVYDGSGRLAGTTFSPRLQNELARPLLNSATMFSLSGGSKSLDLQPEQVGNFQYQTAYLPVRVRAGAPLAFVGLPFVNQPSVWQAEISGFISTLISVYVFLLIFVGASAIYIAGSISQPISDLGASLRKLELGKNEPLIYKRQDELGALIEEYNRTLEKLEESTRKLAQSERESAWREMAKQVAHEIKNPLTPMRLSIQQMQLALIMQPEKATQLVDRVSKTIIQQIDALNEIATAFSNFAKMPQAENTVFSLNELVANVYELFRNEQPQFELSLSIPEETFYVLADKNQLMRVFNNLYKNAIQAIPEGRQGKIDAMIFPTDEGRIVVRVGDNGSGIPEATRDRVFVPNFTTKSSGSGLGLALSKNIVETAGGRIYFETDPEKGTDFFVELPVAQAPQ